MRFNRFAILAAAAVALSALTISPADARRHHAQKIAAEPTSQTGAFVQNEYGWWVYQVQGANKPVRQARKIAHKAPRAQARAVAHKADPVVAIIPLPKAREALPDIPIDANGNPVLKKAGNGPQLASLTGGGYVGPDALEAPKSLGGYKAVVAACPKGNKGSTSLARIVEPLKSKAEEIVRECGAVVVSTDCRGGVTPNHHDHRAVDIRMPGNGSPACIYAHLKDWKGGVSTDYHSAPGTKHVHFSWCPPKECKRAYEWGARFAHTSPVKGTRYAARRGGAQYASAVSSGGNYGATYYHPTQ